MQRRANQSHELTLPEKRDALVAEFLQIKGAPERMARVIEHGRRASPLEAEFKTDSHRVAGCLSNLWLVCSFTDGKCAFRCDSDSAIVKGIATILCEFYSGHRPEEVLAIDPAFLGPVGITQHLTPNRRNALSRVWETIRNFAQSHLHSGADTSL